jgi:uncharacterized membrane protein YdbT with pleckstrin-like domain
MQTIDGEDLIWAGRPVWKWSVTFIGKWGALALLPLVAGVFLHRWFGISIWWFLVATLVGVGVVIIIAWLARIGTYYTVTDRRLIVRHGILSRRERSASLERIQNVNTEQGVIARMLNFGDVQFDTAGSEHGDADLTLYGVADPRITYS